jgi:hypothetical protein
MISFACICICWTGVVFRDMAMVDVCHGRRPRSSCTLRDKAMAGTPSSASPLQVVPLMALSAKVVSKLPVRGRFLSLSRLMMLRTPAMSYSSS